MTKTGKRIVALVAVLALLMSLSVGTTASGETLGRVEQQAYEMYELPGDVQAVDEIDSAEKLEAAVEGADASGSVLTVLHVTGNITIDRLITIKEGQAIQIQSDGPAVYTIDTTASLTRHFDVENSMLVLRDIVLDGNEAGGGVRVLSNSGAGAWCVLQAGAVIQNCRASSAGGGIVVAGSADSGHLFMEGNATIKNCVAGTYGGGVHVDNGQTGKPAQEIKHYFTMLDDAVISGCEGTGGGGLYVGKGAVATLESGTIEYNKTRASAGGGVFITTLRSGLPQFIMNGGTIRGNDTGREGGAGVYVGGGSFVMNDGLITENITLNRVNQNEAGNGAGGGVTVRGIFEMHGGAITKHDTTGSAYGGAGVSVCEDGSFLMTDGEIAYNTSDSNGGGVAIDGTMFEMTGGSIHHNSTPGVGGGVITATSVGGPLTTFLLNGGTVSDNYAGTRGGGVEVNNGILRFEDGYIINNTTDGIGGGVCVTNEALMTGGTVQGNTAQEGGGFYVRYNTSREIKLDITGGSILSNTALGDGGGIYVEKPDYTSLTTGANVKFGGNSAVKAVLPPEHALETYPNIRFASFTLPDHPLNNYDINFDGPAASETYEMKVEVIDEVRAYTLPGVSFTLSYQSGTQTYYYAETISGEHINAYWSTDAEDAYPLVSNEDGQITVPNVLDGVTYTFTQYSTYTGYKPIQEKRFTFEKETPADREIPATPIFTAVYYSQGEEYTRQGNLEYGNTLKAPEIEVREGYTLEGWFQDDETFANKWDFEKDIITNDLELYAKWSLNAHLVTYYLNGEKDSEQTVSYKEEVPLPDHTKDGYTFDGWYTDQELTEPWTDGGTMPDRALDLYAKLTADSRTVTYYLNDGSETSETDDTAFDADYEIRSPGSLEWAWDGYRFLGWSLTENGGADPAYAPGSPVVIAENLELYAVWEVIPAEYQYQVEYYFDGKLDASLIETGHAVAGTVIAEYPDKLKAGYQFERTENLPLTVSENEAENVIRVYYEKTGSAGIVETPHTGDLLPAIFLLVLLICGAAGMSIVMIRKRKA